MKLDYFEQSCLSVSRLLSGGKEMVARGKSQWWKLWGWNLSLQNIVLEYSMLIFFRCTLGAMNSLFCCNFVILF